MKGTVHLVTFSHHVSRELEELEASVLAGNMAFSVLGLDRGWHRNAVKLRLLYDFVCKNPPQEYLLVTDAFDVKVLADAEDVVKKFEALESDIVFSAEANFYFRNPKLSYYYWKFYPRGNTIYKYLNSGSFMGRPTIIKKMLEDIFQLYGVDPRDEVQLNRLRSDQYLFSRFYADVTLGFANVDYSIQLDRKQSLFGCTGGRMVAMPWPIFNWIQSFLFTKYERKFLKTFGLTPCQMFSRDYVIRRGKLFNKKYKTSPAVLHFPGTYARFQVAWKLLKNHVSFSKWSLMWPLALLLSLGAWLRSIGAYLFILYVNKGETRPEEIFRYAPNANAEFDRTAKTFVRHLLSKQPFAFAHHNDGEFTFIQKYLSGQHDDFWFGRKQHQYDKALAQRLKAAVEYQAPNYYVGVPCSICRPDHRKTADELVPDSEHKVPAMSIHHNLSFLPAMLGQLRGRQIFFLVNEYQSLDVFKQLGIEVKKSRVTIVPYLNSYEMYEQLEHKKFPEGAVVVMTCGMLAKILLPVWYKANPDTTFLALGSAMDDLIQPQKMKFRLFPGEFPFTRNLKKYRSFLFGRKAHCPECYTIEKTSF